MGALGAIRSALFVPGNRLDRVDKALATDADMVLIDLEDAVPPAQKAEARAGVADKLAQLEKSRVLVRVNAIDSQLAAADLEALVAATPAGLMVPKVQSAADVERIDRMILAAEEAAGLAAGSLPVIALIESAQGVVNVDAITQAGRETGRVHTAAFGAADYTLDLGTSISAGGEELIYPRSRVCLACRAAGLEPPIDTPFLADLKDLAALETDARRAKQFGFQGKLCIHPIQIEVVNRVFSPSQAEIEFAAQVVSAFEAAEAQGQGAIQVAGKMVDLPVVEEARRTMRLAALLD
jgi:citrate lyase subunit beta / citryl-CoA lyase